MHLTHAQHDMERHVSTELQITKPPAYTCDSEKPLRRTSPSRHTDHNMQSKKVCINKRKHNDLDESQNNCSPHFATQWTCCHTLGFLLRWLVTIRPTSISEDGESTFGSNQSELAFAAEWMAKPIAALLVERSIARLGNGPSKR